MPDSPDYSRYLPGSVRFSLQDMSELAVRLGSFDIFDRRGEVIWYDQFDYGLGGYAVSYSGAGGSVNLSADNRFHYPYNCKIILPSTSPYTAYMNRNVRALTLERVGYEITAAYVGGISQVMYRHEVSDGSDTYYPGILLDAGSRKLYIQDESQSWLQVASLHPFVSAGVWYITFKIVYDLARKHYVRFVTDYMTLDLTPYQFAYEHLGDTPMLSLLNTFVGQAGTAGIVHVASLILTANEP